MTALDMIVMIFFVGLTILIGSISFSRRPTADDFFFAGRAMNKWWIAMSLMATSISTLTLVAFVGEFIRTGLDFVVLLMGLPLGMFLVYRIAIPAFYRTDQPTTIFAYLQKRFGRGAEMAVSLVFCGSRLIWVAMIYYTSSAIIAPIAAMNQYLVMTLIGLISIGYVSAGGIKADIRTDMLQGIVMFLTMGLVAAFLTGAIGKAGQWDLLLARAATHSRAWSFNPGVTSLAAIFIWGIAITFSSYAASQVNAQIYFCSGNLRNAQKSMRRGMLITVLMVALTAWVGLFLGAFFSSPSSPFFGRVVENADRLLAFFVSKSLPKGMLGLFVCGMLAAAMSSVDSVFQAINTIFQVNLRRRTAEDLRRMTISLGYRLRAAGFATLALIAATGIATLKGSLLAKAASISAALDGPLAGVFLAAFCWKRAKSKDILLGVFAGVASWFLMIPRAGLFGKMSVSIYWILPTTIAVTLAATMASSFVKWKFPFKFHPNETGADR